MNQVWYKRVSFGHNLTISSVLKRTPMLHPPILCACICSLSTNCSDFLNTFCWNSINRFYLGNACKLSKFVAPPPKKKKSSRFLALIHRTANMTPIDPGRGQFLKKMYFPAGGGTPRNSRKGCAARFPWILAHFEPSIHTRFQTFVVPYCFASVTKSSIGKIHLKVQLEWSILNIHLELKKTNTFIRSCSSLENHIQLKSQWLKIYHLFLCWNGWKPLD